MRIVAGRRELDDYHGLPSLHNSGGKARLVSFLMMSALSVGASFGAVSLVRNTLDRTLGADTVNRAIQELDPTNASLYALTNTDWPTASVEKTFAQVKSEEFGRRTFGQRKTPPPQPAFSVALTSFEPEDDTGFAPSSAPRHAETNGFAEAPRLEAGHGIEAVEAK